MFYEKKIATEFVPYKLSKKLKKIGFNTDPNNFILCLGWYGKKLSKDKVSDLQIESACYNTLRDANDRIDAPLWQQIFDWFIEAHQMWGEIGFSHNNGKVIYHYYIVGMKTDSEGSAEGYGYETKEEAREACLIRLFGELQLKIDGIIE